MMRPYIICHMMSLLDGRIDCDVTEQIEGANRNQARSKYGAKKPKAGKA